MEYSFEAPIHKQQREALTYGKKIIKRGKNDGGIIIEMKLVEKTPYTKKYKEGQLSMEFIYL